MQIVAVFAVCYSIKTTTTGFKNNCQRGQFKRHFWSHLCIHYSIAIVQYLRGFWSCFIVVDEQFHV